MEHFGGQAATATRETPRPTWRSIKRGLLCRCPKCGDGKLFRAYLKPVDSCAVCGEDFTHQRADDFPPYLAIFISGHVILAGYLAVDESFKLEVWQHMAIWLPLTAIMCLGLLQPLKGGVIGLQWALRMHGFGGVDEDALAAGRKIGDEAA